MSHGPHPKVQATNSPMKPGNLHRVNGEQRFLCSDHLASLTSHLVYFLFLPKINTFEKFSKALVVVFFSFLGGKGGSEKIFILPLLLKSNLAEHISNSTVIFS